MLEADPILAALDRAPTGPARSPLARWLFANHDALEQRLQHQRADWTLLAQAFAEAGITGRDGEPPTPNAVRVAWQRTKRAVAKARASPRKVAKGPVLKPGEIAPGVRRVTPQSEPASLAELATDDEPPAYQFGFASEKKWPKKEDT